MNIIETTVETSVWSGARPQDLCQVDADILCPTKFPPEDPAIFSLPYIEMAKKWQANPNRDPMSEGEILSYYHEALRSLRDLAERDSELDEAAAIAGFDRLWPTLSKQLEEPAFYDWVKKFGIKSAFIHPYFTTLSGRSPALEMAMGYSWDVTGRYRQIPLEDEQGYYMRVAEPTFRSFAQRNWFSQQMGLMDVAKKCGWRLEHLELPVDQRPHRIKVLFLGGGLLPQLRYYDLGIEEATQIFDITVYDADPDALKSLEEIVGRSVTEYDIKYYVRDFSAAFAEEEVDSFYSIISTGMMSYLTGKEKWMLVNVGALLCPGGVFICDYQIAEPSMVRCAYALQWRGTGLDPKKNEDEAIKDMTRNAEGTVFGEMLYSIDHYNGKLPAIVNFCLVKTVA